MFHSGAKFGMGMHRDSIISWTSPMVKVIDQRLRAGVEGIHDACHEKIDLKVFVVVIRKEGWAHVAVPILLLV